MQRPVFDEAKLSDVTEIIDSAAELMDTPDYRDDEASMKKLSELQNSLRQITGRPDADIEDYAEYWSYTDLDSAAIRALLPVPAKEDITDERIREIILGMNGYEEYESEWYLAYLKLNTGITDISNYIYFPDKAGLPRDASSDQIAEKIIADRK